ncbi:MAG: nucleotidyltransferase family protein [Nocardioides sp.]
MLPPVAGLLLAAGEGRRYGGPKALVEGWLHWAVNALDEGGCSEVTVVLGAGADEARELVPDGVRIVVAEDWAEGMGASLRAGLDALADSDAVAAVVHLVDLPDVRPSVVSRLLGVAGEETLARAAYHGTAGHPVMLGRAHWAGVRESAVGDQGARAYLSTREVDEIECGDLAEGTDVDVHRAE